MNVFTDTLPHIVFFEPTPEFVSYIQKLMQERKLSGVIDLGSGAGFMAKTLADAGLKVLAVDLFERDEPLYPVALLDATEMDIPQNTLPIMARPCHNDWIDRAVENAMKNVSLFVYVGLEKNFVDDLSELQAMGYTLKIEAFKAGIDGERVVLITKKS